MEDGRALELYIHIPFCVRKCLYCDFLSFPADDKTQDAYVEALISEITRRSKEGGAYRVVSVFIGGGTPSKVEPDQIGRVLECVRANYCLAEDAEITMEVNPGTVDENKLRKYKKAGINRLSIGLQSAHDKELKKLGRIHTWQEFLEGYQVARKCGFSNINIDLMSGLPGQITEDYINSLNKVCSLPDPPEHISAYSLIVEEGTPFALMEQEGRLRLPDEDMEREMYEKTECILREFGYKRYEISNYAKEGYECLHNLGYWTGVEYLGFGIGAASLMKGERFRNDDNISDYIENPLGCRRDRQLLSRKEQMEEFCFLGLRLIRGICGEDFYHKFGVNIGEIYGDIIRKNSDSGLLEVLKGERGQERIALTSRGLDLANYVMAQFLLDEE